MDEEGKGAGVSEEGRQDSDFLGFPSRDDFLRNAKHEATKLLYEGKYSDAIVYMAVRVKLAEITEGYSGSTVDNLLLPLAELYLRNGDFHGLQRWIVGFR